MLIPCYNVNNVRPSFDLRQKPAKGWKRKKYHRIIMRCGLGMRLSWGSVGGMRGRRRTLHVLLATANPCTGKEYYYCMSEKDTKKSNNKARL